MKRPIPRRASRPLQTLAAPLTALALCGCAMLFGPHEKHASASLLPVARGGAHGVIMLAERADGVQVTYNIAGLPPDSDHALRIHEGGDCRGPDAPASDPVFSPAAGRANARARAGGDLANIHADANGVAVGFVVSNVLSLDGIHSVIGRSVVIHRGASDRHASANQDVGPALTCGATH